MKMFFQILVVLMLGFMTAGCMGTGYWNGPRATQNYPAGSSHWQSLPPITQTTYHIGNGGGGGGYMW